MSLGANIKRLRRDQGLTQGGLAKISGVKVGHISKLERDTSDPKLSTIYKLISAFKCSPDDLLEDYGKMDTDGILKATLARTKALPENNKRIIIDVVDKYCAAVGFAENFTGDNGPKIRIFTSASEPAIPKEQD